jgi:hypothetical protein
MICTSLFATTTVNSYAIDGAFYGNGLHLGKTLAVLVVLVPWVCIFTWGCLFVTDKIMSLRVSGELKQLECNTSCRRLLLRVRQLLLQGLPPGFGHVSCGCWWCWCPGCASSRGGASL